MSRSPFAGPSAPRTLACRIALVPAMLLVFVAAPLAQTSLFPFGWALSPDQTLLFRTEVATASVSVTDVDPASPTFLHVLARIPVGSRPAGIAASVDGLDVLVANHGDGTLSIIDVRSLAVRKTIASPHLDGPWDVVMGPREDVTVAFASGTYHAYVTNRNGKSVAVFESGPDGLFGLGFDNIIGSVRRGSLRPMLRPRGAIFDPDAPLDAFANTVGTFVAHASPSGHGIASRVMYVADAEPGPTPVDTTVERPSFRGKRFEIVQQYVSTHIGDGLDVALADETLSVSNPTRLYLSMTGGVVDVFDVETGALLQRIHTGVDIEDLAPFLKP